MRPEEVAIPPTSDPSHRPEPPDTREPMVTEPMVTEPMVTEPMVIEPMVIEPVMTEIVRSKLEAMSQEMLHLLHRSAYSTLMRESRDCSFHLTTPTGALVADGPLHYQFAVENLLAKHRPGPGEIWISNHPFEVGVQHTPDLMVICPVFEQGTAIGFSCAVAHKSDTGGALVGSVSMLSTEIFQEGLLLPLMHAGTVTDEGFELDDRIVRLIATNVRDPDLYLGDMRAQIGVVITGAKRLSALAQSVGVGTLLGAYGQILELGESFVRRHLSAWPDGSVTVEGFLDRGHAASDVPVRYEVVVQKQGDEITFDFSGSDDQVSGPVNMIPAYLEGSSLYPSILAVTDPAVGFNSGMRRPVRVVTRPGSVFDPRFPAAVGATTTVMYRAQDVILEALAHFVPTEAVANGSGAGGSTALLWHGDAGGRTSRSMQYEVLAGATGATYDRDGCDGTGAGFFNNPVTPIEILESQFPVRIERFELVCDTGGPGRHRGGLSYRRQYRCLAPATLNRRADRGRFPAKGIQGGMPGSCSKLLLNPFTDAEQEAPIAGRYEFAAGESFMGVAAGGGGCGDPLSRDPAAVAYDVAIGYVSRASAVRDYGVVLRDDGSVDEDATGQLRATRRKAADAAGT